MLLLIIYAENLPTKKYPTTHKTAFFAICVYFFAHSYLTKFAHFIIAVTNFLTCNEKMTVRSKFST